MHDPLAPLLADGVIDEVVARLKSGKEADLWLVRHGAETVAAKIYKARDTRSFKNDVAYREGRQVRNSRTQRAMDRGSRFGRAASEEDWKAREADALHALHAAGVRVPRPVLYYEGVLLMELVVDGEGRPAPRLVDAPLDAAQAVEVYAELRGQAVRMLCTDRIHGDLSPYNVLLGRDGPVIIDFPQVIGAAHNSQAERFFTRDLENLRLHLESIAPVLRARAGDARQIWRAYTRRELTPEFVPQERPPDEVSERRHDRPRRDRSRDDRPQGDRPRSDRPQGDRPLGDHPRNDRPHGDGPRVDRPRGDRPRGDRPRGDRPRNDRPQGDRPPQAPPRQPAPHGQGPSRSARPDPGRPDPRERRQHGDRGQRRDARGQGQGPERQRDDRRGDRPPRRESSQPEVVRVQRLAPAPARPASPSGDGRPPQPPGPPHPHRGQGDPGQRGPRDRRDPDGRRRR